MRHIGSRIPSTQMDAMQVEKDKKVPVTILTGHLGAGKTTLLRRILRNKLGLRIAVIENEFGNEIGIERLLANVSVTDDADDDQAAMNEVVTLNSEDLFIELSNGCVCCSVKDSLVNTLETLLEKNRNRFDHIVIETTGLADPGPLAGVFWLDDELESDLKLDGVVTVVDLANIEARLNDTKANEAKLQVAYADRIILNKRELVSDQAFQSAVARLRSINPFAPMEATSYGKVDLQFCLNICAYDSSRLKLRGELFEVDHDPTVKSVVLRREDRPISVKKLRDWIGLMLWEPPDGLEIFRVKGVLWGVDDEEAVSGDVPVRIIQGVHKIFDIERLADTVKWADVDEAKPITKIVVIGRGIRPSVLKKQFQEAL